MANERLFNIILKSKYAPEGVKGAIAGLKSIGEASFFIQRGLIMPLEQAGRVILDFVAAANPERVKAMTDAFAGLKVAVGSLVDDAIGPLLSGITDIVNQATLLSNLPKNLAPIYDDLIKRQEKAGKSAIDLAREVRAGSDAAVASARQAKDQNPASMIGVSAEDAAVQVDQFRSALIRNSRTVDEYIQALNAGRIAITNLADEVARFNAAKGIQIVSPIEVTAGATQLLSITSKIDADLTQQRQAAALQRSFLILDIAQRERDRLSDVARQSAKQLADIDAQRISALAQASQTLANTLANIDTQSVQRRIDIEQQYQDSIRQIKQSSDLDIEEAIRRRDARGLAAALRNRSQQLDEAGRDRDKSAASNQRAAEQQRQQAQAAFEQQRRDAEDAARAQVDQVRRQNQDAQREAEIAYGRQLRDFDTANKRRLMMQGVQAIQEINAARKQFKTIQDAYKAHLNEMARITEQQTAQGSPLANAIKNLVLFFLKDLNTSTLRKK